MTAALLPTDPQTLGAIALVLVAAAAVWYAVFRFLKGRPGAPTLAFLIACAFVAGLAYLGVPAAGWIVVAMIVILAIVWGAMALLNG